jgi:KDO2-lipid IV(A) lauroyltransferase
LYDPPRLAALDPVIRGARSRAGARLLPIEPGGLRAFYAALRAGRLTALLPDQVPPRDGGEYADFFGRPALTMTFAHRLIRRLDPVVLLAAAIRVDGGFCIRFDEVDEAIRDPDPATSAAAMNRAVEALVRRFPAQYQWEYKRFKRPPPGQPDAYRCR